MKYAIKRVCSAFTLVLLVARFPGTASGQCIDYQDYLHVGASLDLEATLDVAVSGSYAYVLDVGGVLHVIDITNPGALTVVGHVATSGGDGIAVSQPFAYIAAASRVEVVDLGDPALPTVVGHVDMPANAWSIVLSGHYAYVAADTSGLQVLDITNPY